MVGMLELEENPLTSPALCPPVERVQGGTSRQQFNVNVNGHKVLLSSDSPQDHYVD
jgi:hypothetical protein